MASGSQAFVKKPDSTPAKHLIFHGTHEVVMVSECKCVSQVCSESQNGLNPISDFSDRLDERALEIEGRLALARGAQWTECWPTNQRVAGSIPSQGTCLCCRPGP